MVDMDRTLKYSRGHTIMFSNFLENDLHLKDELRKAEQERRAEQAKREHLRDERRKSRRSE